MKICIDPGHSGPIEPGACAVVATEAAVTLQISKTIAKLLEAAGHEVMLTREKNVNNKDLSWRVEAAWEFGAEIFISIHCNACENPAANGTEVWYFPGSDTGRLLARCIQAELVANCLTCDRGVKTNDKWTVLLETACPAVLVELAFITNDKEREMLTDRFVQRQFAVGVVQGVTRFADGGAPFGGVKESKGIYQTAS